MAVTRRRRPDQTTPQAYPKLSSTEPKGWPQGLYPFLRDLMGTLEADATVIIGVQDNSTDKPLRAKLNFIGTSLSDDRVNDRTTISIGGGAGAAPVNATYLTVSLNGTLTDERVLVAGAGLTSADGGAGSNFTLNVGAGLRIIVNADTVDWTGLGVRKSNLLTGIRRDLNLIEGADISVTEVDDSLNDKVDVTVAAVPTYARQFLLMGA